MKKENLHNYYLKLQEKLEEEYGSRSVLLMRIGDFYECYESPKLGKSTELSKLFNSKLALQNSNKEYSENNLKMIGFSSICFIKIFINIDKR